MYTRFRLLILCQRLIVCLYPRFYQTFQIAFCGIRRKTSEVTCLSQTESEASSKHIERTTCFSGPLHITMNNLSQKKGFQSGVGSDENEQVCGCYRTEQPEVDQTPSLYLLSLLPQPPPKIESLHSKYKLQIQIHYNTTCICVMMTGLPKYGHGGHFMPHLLGTIITCPYLDTGRGKSISEDYHFLLHQVSSSSLSSSS